jgi:hypothetical protein
VFYSYLFIFKIILQMRHLKFIPFFLMLVWLQSCRPEAVTTETGDNWGVEELGSDEETPDATGFVTPTITDLQTRAKVMYTTPTVPDDTVKPNWTAGLTCTRYVGYYIVPIEYNNYQCGLSFHRPNGGFASLNAAISKVTVKLGDTTYNTSIENWSDTLVEIAFENKRKYLRNSSMQATITVFHDNRKVTYYSEKINCVGAFVNPRYNSQYQKWFPYGSGEYEVALHRYVAGLQASFGDFTDFTTAYIPSVGDAWRRIGGRVDDTHKKESFAVVYSNIAHTTKAGIRVVSTYERNLKCTGGLQRKHYEYPVSTGFVFKAKTGDRPFFAFSR